MLLAMAARRPDPDRPSSPAERCELPGPAHPHTRTISQYHGVGVDRLFRKKLRVVVSVAEIHPLTNSLSLGSDAAGGSCSA